MNTKLLLLLPAVFLVGACSSMDKETSEKTIEPLIVTDFLGQGFFPSPKIFTPASIAEVLDHDFLYDGVFVFEDKATKQTASAKTCNQLLSLASRKPSDGSEFHLDLKKSDATYNDYRNVLHMCHIYKTLSSIKPAKVSYLGEFQLDEKTMMDFPPHFAFELEASSWKAAIKNFNSWGEYIKDQQKNGSYSGLTFKRNGNYELVINDGEDDDSIQRVTALARGDFTGDGVEDILVNQDISWERGMGLSRQYVMSVFLITKLSKDGKYKLLDQIDYFW